MKGDYSSRGTLTRRSATISKVRQKGAFPSQGEVNKDWKELGVCKQQEQVEVAVITQYKGILQGGEPIFRGGG